MTLYEFEEGLKGDPLRLSDGRRARYVVAEALIEYAKTVDKTQAARLRYVAGKAECGIDVGKSMRKKLAVHICRVRDKVVKHAMA